jgi:SAM-dependent methyltransferase
MKSHPSSAQLVRSAFEAFSANPPDLRQLGESEGEVSYVKTFLPTYERTVTDVLNLFAGKERLDQLRIVELGAFLGIVSKALALTSAKVVACDIPEFFARENVRAFYRAMGVEIQAFNLREYKLPFETASQDCVIACETFEHLNFNPLPVFAEINRVLKPGRFFYIAMPNASYLLKRIHYLISGNTPGFSVDDLFMQLDARKNMVVGLHWKEYSMRQTIQMATAMGFEVVTARTVSDAIHRSQAMHKRIVRALTPGGDTQVVVCRKTSDFKGDFLVSADS